MTAAVNEKSKTMVIIEDACTFSGDKSHGKIVIQGLNPSFPDAIESLSGVEPRNMAIGFACSQGVADARINGNVIGPYPVNKKGVNIYEVFGPNRTELPADHPDKQPKAYRVDVPVCRKLV